MERDNLEDRKGDGRITLRCILKDWRMGGWKELAQDRIDCEFWH
jgi:hypothetical protein